MSESGSASVQDKEKALLSEIVQKLNDLFTGELTEGDMLSYAMAVKTKLVENQTLVVQAGGNLKEQFGNSPSLTPALTDAIIAAFDSHAAMSKQALENPATRKGLLEILLGPGQLYEALRERALASA